MSYRNPQQNVDTQSAQGIANLQRTIAGTFGGIVQQELQTQKELGIQQKKLADKRAKELKEYEKLEEQVALGIKNYEIDNPDLKLGDSMAPLVDSYSDIMTRINSGAVTDPKEIAALRSQATDILTIPKRIGNMLESISATDLLMAETESKSGSMGGLDPSQEGNMPEAMRVLMNKAKGDRSTRIEFENGKYKAYIDVTPEGGEKITLTEEQLADYLSGKAQGVQIIPDATESMENLKTTHIYNKDSKTGKLTPKDSAFGEETTREIKDKKGNVIRIETYKPLKRDYLASAGKAVIESEISAMSKTEKVAFMNNIVAPDTKGFTINNIENKESKEALLKGYTDYWLNNFASDQVISTRNVALPKENKPNTAEKKEVAMAKKYKLAKNAIQNSTDDLNFGYKGYDTEEQYKKIFSFAGRGELGITVEKIEDEKGQVDKIIVKSLNNPRQEYVIDKGFTSERVKGILLKAAQGADTAEDEDYENLTDEEKSKKLIEKYKK